MATAPPQDCRHHSYILLLTSYLPKAIHLNSKLLQVNRSVTHTARGGDGREERRECGYYNLHRDLNDFLFHTPNPFLIREIRVQKLK